MEVRQKDNGLEIVSHSDKKRSLIAIKKLKEILFESEVNSKKDKTDYSVRVYLQNNPSMNVKGWYSLVVEDSGRLRQVLFLDYDDIRYNFMESELKWLINQFNLTPFYILSSFENKNKNGVVYGNYLAICIQKFDYQDIIALQKPLSIDYQYKQVARSNYYKSWCLRLGEKGEKKRPQFKCVIGDLNKKYSQEVSNSHLQMLKALYKIPDIKYSNLDNGTLKTIRITEYVTGSK